MEQEYDDEVYLYWFYLKSQVRKNLWTFLQKQGCRNSIWDFRSTSSDAPSDVSPLAILVLLMNYDVVGIIVWNWLQIYHIM